MATLWNRGAIIFLPCSFFLLSSIFFFPSLLMLGTVLLTYHHYSFRPNILKKSVNKNYKPEMWANAQRDGCPAKYRWRPLFNAAKFSWRPLLECCAVTLPRRKTRWNLLGCPKLPNRSQPLVGRSLPYCEDMWRRYCCLTSFFTDCLYVPLLQRCSQTKLCEGAQMAIFWVLHFQRATCSTFQTCILNLH